MNGFREPPCQCSGHNPRERTIGIGITTRNRPKVLEACLNNIINCGIPNFYKIVIIDDASTITGPIPSHPKFEFVHSPVRLGIAKAKNACLWRLRDCDDIFLLDDDCWPEVGGWAEDWAARCRENDVHHCIWTVDHTLYPDMPSYKQAVYEHLEIFGEHKYSRGFAAVRNCLGMMMYLSKHCLETVGGFDTDIPNVYGYEHAQYSNRAFRAGMAGKSHHPYITPLDCARYFFGMDIRIEGMIDPLLGYPEFYGSSLTEQEKLGADLNGVMMQRQEIYIPLTDPLGEV